MTGWRVTSPAEDLVHLDRVQGLHTVKQRVYSIVGYLETKCPAELEITGHVARNIYVFDISEDAEILTAQVYSV